MLRICVVGIALLVLSTSLSVQVARADSVGINVSGGVNYSVPGVVSNGSQEIVSGINTIIQNVGTNGTVVQDSYNMGPAIGGNQTVTFFDPSPNANGLFTSTSSAFVNTLSINGGELRGWVTASAGNSDANTAGSTAGTAFGQMLWTDTVVVASNSLPTGTPVTLAVSDDLTGSIASSGNTVASLVNHASVGSVQFTNIYQSPGPTSFGETVMLNTFVGASLNLEEQLNLEASATTNGSGDVNAADTAFLNIRSLTPGAGLTSASGIDYSTVGVTSPVPESSTLLLLGIGLISILCMSLLKVHRC